MQKRFRKLFGRYNIEEVLIVPYRSYGTAFHLYIKGRVLDNDPLEMPEKQSFLQTLGIAFKQFDTHEIGNCAISLTIAGVEIATVTNKKGYFLIDAVLPSDISKLTDKEGWMMFELRTTDRSMPEVVVTGEFLIPEKEADFGIISDIDDTILNTGVTSFLKWKVIFNSFFVNAYSRIPLVDAPDLYRKLHYGVANKEKNPIFYLSNSPWNMYQYLRLFLEHNGFPKGPILLRSFNSMFQRVTSEKPHKQKEILNLLETYPDLKFIMIGDSGEHDATIYTEIAAQFPHRILCIYLRSVNHRRKMQVVKSIVDNFRTIPVLLVQSSAEAEAHARANGFI
ncbi:MAG TPA: phosphatase domain-containing protein [Flavobacterium sp.]|jgi:phosphatidate phosphatase APP1